MKIAVLTISDTRTKETDKSGALILKILKNIDCQISEYEILKDEKEKIKEKLIYYADVLKLDLVITGGGTGLGPRDVTPEATLEVIDKKVPGIPELIRAEGIKKTNRATLSRGEAGIRNNTLIINLPGSPKGTKESLKAIIEIIPHAIEMIKGGGH